ncbi:hypothetical protein KGA66_28555, partial [Actinocrinis puniceicyclus]|nr:hypothetical protein [Actinocrinis puniceicyclus]
AGVGDWIVTRQNERRLRAGTRDFVKNGDAWRVVERRESGALLVEHLEHRGRVLLPAGYVAGNVELLYATTAHRAQGTTVDACHALVSEEMGRENFYVTVSRARHGTVLYVATHELASVDEDEHVDALRFDADAYAAREILEHVVARESAERSATEQIAAAYGEAESLATLVPRYEHALDVATDGHYRQMVERVLPDLAEQVIADPAWPAVQRALRDAEADGWAAALLLQRAARAREMDSAVSLAQVLSWRLRHVIDHEHPVGALAAVPIDVERYRALLAVLAPDLAAEADRAYAKSTPAACLPGSAVREREYLRALHKMFGTVRVNRARNESGWPALLLALRRADDLGYEPQDVLAAALDRRALRAAPSMSQALALRIHRHVAAGTDRDSGDPRTAWVHIVQFLARLEHAGTDPASALSQALESADGGSDRCTLAALARRLRASAHAVDSVPLPAWLKPAPRVEDPAWQPYLDARTELVRRRIDALADTAASERPAWTAHLGAEPADPAERERWLRHLATLAAYRDQYQVQGDDPDHPLGPYPERGRTGHRAYWVAAASLLALRGRAAGGDDALGRLAADQYRTLSGDEQACIARELAGRLGSDWLGDPRDPAADADEAVYRDDLAALLVAHGRLHAPSTGESEPPSAHAARRTPSAKQRHDRRSTAVGRRLPTLDGPQSTEIVSRPRARVALPPPMPDQPRGPRPGR